MSLRVEVMDSMFGRPAAGVPVTLQAEAGAAWRELTCAVTDEAGCISDLDSSHRRGRYRLVISFDEYFAGLGLEPFHSRVEVVFRIFHAREAVRVLITATPSMCSVSRLTIGGPDGG
jgi:5-hydroxyisourate hydrolase